VHEQKRVARVGVARQHEDRPTALAQHTLGRPGLLHAQLEVDRALARAIEAVEEPAHHGVIAALHRGPVCAPAEPARDPQGKARHRGGRIARHVVEEYPGDPQRPAAPVEERGQSGEREDQGAEDREGQAQRDEQGRQYAAARDAQRGRDHVRRWTSPAR
jgi:hypothetical protein